MKIHSSKSRTNPSGLTVGALVFAGCAFYSVVISFIGLYIYSFTSDLKRELAEAKFDLLDVTDATKHAVVNEKALTHAAEENAAAEYAVKRLGSASGTTTSYQILHDDDSIDILREMDDYMNRDRLKKIAEKYRTEYANAQPFPSHVFDDIFPRRMLLKIMEEHPESALVQGCLPGPTNEACAKGEVKGQLFKSRIDNDKNMGFFTKLFMGYIKSSAFINFLEILSGIKGIIPDPHYTGAGLHFTASGGKLDIHADFNTLLTHKLERRVNLLLFLNDDWKPEYGGHLELWSRDMKRCAQKVAPRLGRMAVFSTTDFSYHGHPHELAAPPGRARRSIAMYYYTPDRPKNECRNHKCSFESNFTMWHSTVFMQPKCGSDCEDEMCNHLPVPNPYAH